MSPALNAFERSPLSSSARRGELQRSPIICTLRAKHSKAKQLERIDCNLERTVGKIFRRAESGANGQDAGCWVERSAQNCTIEPRTIYFSMLLHAVCLKKTVFKRQFVHSSYRSSTLRSISKFIYKRPIIRLPIVGYKHRKMYCYNNTTCLFNKSNILLETTECIALISLNVVRDFAEPEKKKTLSFESHHSSKPPLNQRQFQYRPLVTYDSKHPLKKSPALTSHFTSSVQWSSFNFYSWPQKYHQTTFGHLLQHPKCCQEQLAIENLFQAFVYTYQWAASRYNSYWHGLRGTQSNPSAMPFMGTLAFVTLQSVFALLQKVYSSKIGKSN